jgi:hypothetical protein
MKLYTWTSKPLFEHYTETISVVAPNETFAKARVFNYLDARVSPLASALSEMIIKTWVLTEMPAVEGKESDVFLNW